MKSWWHGTRAVVYNSRIETSGFAHFRSQNYQIFPTFWGLWAPKRVIHHIHLTGQKRYVTEQKWIWPVIVTGDYPKIISSPVIYIGSQPAVLAWPKPESSSNKLLHEQHTSYQMTPKAEWLSFNYIQKRLKIWVKTPKDNFPLHRLVRISHLDDALSKILRDWKPSKQSAFSAKGQKQQEKEKPKV